MTLENDHTCSTCPNAVNGGRVLFRSCSLTTKSDIEGNSVIECNKRPELGIFEPSIRTNDCPILTKNNYII